MGKIPSLLRLKRSATPDNKVRHQMVAFERRRTGGQGVGIIGGHLPTIDRASGGNLESVGLVHTTTGTLRVLIISWRHRTVSERKVVVGSKIGSIT